MVKTVFIMTILVMVSGCGPPLKIIELNRTSTLPPEVLDVYSLLELLIQPVGEKIYVTKNKGYEDNDKVLILTTGNKDLKSFSGMGPATKPPPKWALGKLRDKSKKVWLSRWHEEGRFWIFLGGNFNTPNIWRLRHCKKINYYHDGKDYFVYHFITKVFLMVREDGGYKLIATINRHNKHEPYIIGVLMFVRKNSGQFIVVNLETGFVFRTKTAPSPDYTGKKFRTEYKLLPKKLSIMWTMSPIKPSTDMPWSKADLNFENGAIN